MRIEVSASHSASQLTLTVTHLLSKDAPHGSLAINTSHTALLQEAETRKVTFERSLPGLVCSNLNLLKDSRVLITTVSTRQSDSACVMFFVLSIERGTLQLAAAAGVDGVSEKSRRKGDDMGRSGARDITRFWKRGGNRGRSGPRPYIVRCGGVSSSLSGDGLLPHLPLQSPSSPPSYYDPPHSNSSHIGCYSQSGYVRIDGEVGEVGCARDGESTSEYVGIVWEDGRITLMELIEVVRSGGINDGDKGRSDQVNGNASHGFPNTPNWPESQGADDPKVKRVLDKAMGRHNQPHASSSAPPRPSSTGSTTSSLWSVGEVSMRVVMSQQINCLSPLGSSHPDRVIDLEMLTPTTDHQNGDQLLPIERRSLPVLLVYLESGNCYAFDWFTESFRRVDDLDFSQSSLYSSRDWVLPRLTSSEVAHPSFILKTERLKAQISFISSQPSQQRDSEKSAWLAAIVGLCDSPSPRQHVLERYESHYHTTEPLRALPRPLDSVQMACRQIGMSDRMWRRRLRGERGDDEGAEFLRQVENLDALSGLNFQTCRSASTDKHTPSSRRRSSYSSPMLLSNGSTKADADDGPACCTNGVFTNLASVTREHIFHMMRGSATTGSRDEFMHWLRRYILHIRLGKDLQQLQRLQRELLNTPQRTEWAVHLGRMGISPKKLFKKEIAPFLQ
eukprot:GHVN01098846.1.p1 GENE.GHVN01098846.1~~GHVN01098846.1.p1  ORF type:complete len:675 (+),score=132.06 GHVN01098846.1:380-2404(+)